MRLGSSSADVDSQCDEQFPCSNCVKRGERCIHSKPRGCSSNQLSLYSPQLQSTGVGAVDNTSINLLHLELFSHFQRDLVDTLAFSDIWPQVLPWSFQVWLIPPLIKPLFADEDSRTSTALRELV